MPLLDLGDGPCVFLLHGFPADARAWGDAAAILASEFRVIAPDFPGFGRGATPPEGEYTMETLARFVLELADERKIDRFAVAGLSMGGYVGLALARLAPDRLRGLCLVDSRINADDEKARANRDAMAKLAREQGTAAVVERMLPNLLHSSAYANDPQVVDRLRDIGLDQPAETLARATLAMRDRQAFDVAQLKCPLSVIVGEDDRTAPVALARSIAEQKPGTRLDVIDGAGHFSPLEQPAAVAAAIAAFLK